jgi:asparagine synthase (glutamine-hydrolysing)
MQASWPLVTGCSIVDLGPANVQPMRFKNYVISYNGEIYNFRQIRDELKKLGYQFTTDTDTEVILSAYDAWKENCIIRFVGMWAFVLYDEERKSIFCSRDRFGIKPLYYCRLKEKFLIGSEIKQFTVFNDFHPALNSRAAFDFLYSGRLNIGEDTMFENVKSVPAGNNMYYDLESHTYWVKRWYDLNAVRQNDSITLQDAIAEFRERFGESMLEHLYARVTAGSCLSGGIDSTSMVGMANKIGASIKTFSSCYFSKTYNEINYINTAIDSYQLENYKVFPDVQDLVVNDELAKIVYLQDQPILGGSFFSEYKVFELAAKHNTRVMLSGQGVDEYLGGYSEFYEVFLTSLLRRNIFAYLNEISKLQKTRAN